MRCAIERTVPGPRVEGRGPQAGCKRQLFKAKCLPSSVDSLKVLQFSRDACSEALVATALQGARYKGD